MATKPDIPDETSGHFPAETNILNKKLGHFPAVLTTTNLDISYETWGHFPTGQQNWTSLMRSQDIFQLLAARKTYMFFFYKTLRHFLVIFEATQQDIFYKTSETHPVSFTGERRLVFSLLSLHYWCGQHVVASCLKTPELVLLQVVRA